MNNDFVKSLLYSIKADVQLLVMRSELRAVEAELKRLEKGDVEEGKRLVELKMKIGG